MSRAARVAVASVVTAVVVVAAVAYAVGVVWFLGPAWGVLLIVAAYLVLRFTPPWSVLLFPDDVTSWAALVPELWRWVDRAPRKGVPSPGRQPSARHQGLASVALPPSRW